MTTDKDASKDTTKTETARREEEVLAFWRDNDIFTKSLELDAPQGEFVFYEGPPTANNHPAIHHLEARAFKDLIPRYKTMRGYHVRRKAGWDTHGLPVELEVEKELGLRNKKDVEAYGVEPFNKKCKESVLRYIDEWKEFTDRIGFWVNHDDTYFTFANSYIESVWNVVKKIEKRKLLYKDYRVVPWCTRCGTPLSSHEVADGYKDVTDTSVTVKFKVQNPEKHHLPENTYILAWTTTPWTLPGNVALAVGKDIEYVSVRMSKKLPLALTPLDTESPSGNSISTETYILAKERLEGLRSQIEQKYVIHDQSIKVVKKLVGLEYEPLFPFLKDNLPEDQKDKLKNAFKVYAADFVTTQDGTGVVHTAVMYGIEDFELGSKKEVNLPKFHTVAEDGRFIDAVKISGTEGKQVKGKDEGASKAFDAAIFESLGDKVFSKEPYVHSYPHCWRCKTPLIYYARDSWFIGMSTLRDELVEENQKIHWEPAHIRDGRFGEWLREVKDWAISRNRYWGTPLPIWRRADGSYIVIGSMAELAEYTKKSGNRYTIMRHGEAENNVLQVASGVPDVAHRLTKKGRQEIENAAKELARSGEDFDYIYVSPFVRTRESAEFIAEILDIDVEKIIIDDRLREFSYGELDGRPITECQQAYPTSLGLFDVGAPGGDSFADVKKRVGDFLYDMEQKHENARILIISHGDATLMMQAAAVGANREETLAMMDTHYLKPAHYRTMDFTPIPHNDEYELDVHRPYIDDIELIDEAGEPLTRVDEVMDVWFDSGAMPFAQDHYPFENQELIDGPGYPADFISEAIDQTRGWFYTLHAIGVLMGRGAAYRNVICLGHLLDDKGKKMSKSVGNVIRPWEVIPKYGVDALRFWMYTANEPGASKNFDERIVDEIVKKNITRLVNVLSFYNLNKDVATHEASRESTQVLDQWIIAQFDALVTTTTANLDAYRIDQAARPISDFIDDLSTWYVRRSRDRFKGDDAKDKAHALATYRYILRELSKVMAPFMPFISEHVYQAVKGSDDAESVHLAAWPEALSVDTELIEKMKKAREVVTLALEARNAANIKVRQPLAKLTLRREEFGVVSKEFLPIIAEEVNVKHIEHGDMEAPIVLDTTITPALRAEGVVRDVMRAVQDLRKKSGLKQGEKAALSVKAEGDVKEILSKAQDELSKACSLSSITFVDTLEGEEVKVGDAKVILKMG